MKTFKLLSLRMVEEFGLIDIELDDGLIINKEDDQRTWIVEAYTIGSYKNYFESLLHAGNELTLQVTISRKENDPAFFQGTLITIRDLGDQLSILFKGTIRSRNDYAEQLLAVLVRKGLSGKDLLEEFKNKMISRPWLK